MRLAGIGTDRTLDEVYKFVPPVSPDLAARWAGVEIDLGRISMSNSLINDWLIVEGAGGVVVPINQKQFVLDLMVKFKLPVIVAARSALGTVNHTLLTLAALHAAELPVHGVVLIGDQNRENRETIERFGHVRVIGEIPKLPNLHRTALMQVFMNHFDRAAFEMVHEDLHERSEEHTSELQSPCNLVCRLLLEKKNNRQPRRCGTHA